MFLLTVLLPLLRRTPRIIYFCTAPVASAGNFDELIMAEELRKQCKHRRCGRTFANYANLVLHERTAHVSVDILQNFGSLSGPLNEEQEQDIAPHLANEPTFEEKQLRSSFREGIDQPRTSTILSCGEQPLNALTSGMDYEYNHNKEEEQNIEHGDNNALGASFSTHTVYNPIRQSENSTRSADGDEDLLSFYLNCAGATDDLMDESLPRDIHSFYKSFGDTSDTIFSNVNELSPKLDELPDSCQVIIRDCMRRRMSRKDIYNQYSLASKLEEIYDCHLENTEAIPSVTRTFPNGKRFVERVVKERKLLVKNQGWRLACLKNSLGITQHGVFLPIMVVLRRVVREAGGVGSIQEQVQKKNDDGNRLYSCPIDSDIIEMVSSKKDRGDVEKRSYKKLFFSIYCDETLLAKSGSQDAAVIRVRVDNVPELNTEWFDLGIPPKLRIGIDPISEGKKRSAKLDLLHRFMFLIFEEISYPNHGITAEKYGFEPCLLGFVVDQPQEREFCCLKRGNCEQDCSVCCFKSAEDRLKRKRAREDSTHGSRIALKEGDTQVISSDYLFEEECFASSSQPFYDVTQRAPPLQIGNRYENRDARKTVRLQLQAAVEKRIRSKESSFRLTGTNAIPPGQLAKTMNNRLFEQGALPFPPVFECLKGICDGLCRLYTLPTIDLLHCFDLGPSKQFCDDTFRVLEQPLYGGTSSRSRLVKILNQRIADLSGDTEVRGLRPFKATESDRQASYSGKQRRLLCPILWAVIPGINPQLAPDNDPLYIVALSLDRMQAELRGINRSISSRMRTTDQVHDLQEMCRTACKRFMQCFDVNESTKLHRFMVHIESHLRAFGNLRMSDTGRNKTMLRGVKESYRATNKHLQEIGPQLLQVNISAEVTGNTGMEPAVCHLLLTRDPPATSTRNSTVPDIRNNWDNVTKKKRDENVQRENE